MKTSAGVAFTERGVRVRAPYKPGMPSTLTQGTHAVCVDHVHACMSEASPEKPLGSSLTLSPHHRVEIPPFATAIEQWAGL